jgi:pimeloyl-ACP methyl ester carboxylesterase
MRIKTAFVIGWLAAASLVPLAAHAQSEPVHPKLKRTYVSLTDYGFKAAHDSDANAVLVESPTNNRNARIAVINTHPKNRNNFEYFVGTIMAERGYRVIEVNDYGPEMAEDLLQPVAAAVRYARSLPGVEKVILVGHSGGGPVLSYYEEIAEKGPAACQEPNRLYPCKADTKRLENLPKADALLLLEVNTGAVHRSLSLDPAIDSANPRTRDPALDMYAAHNGFDPKTNTASYSSEFVKRYQAAQRARNERVLAQAKGMLKDIDDGKALFKDDEPFLVPGMSESSSGARLNLADPKVLGKTHGKHKVLKADGTMPVEIVPMIRKPAATKASSRDTLDSTAQSMTVREFLSMGSITMTPDFAITEDTIKGVDWRSSGNSPIGNVQNISAPTLVMAGNCMIHMVPMELIFDHSAAKDKEFVAVDGGDHDFEPCRPEFGDTQKRTFDYIDAWLAKRF